MLKESVTEWELPFKKGIPIVTDNASNMDIAASTAELEPHVGCFAHTINLACQRGLKVPALSRLLGRIRKVVGFFHRSTTAAAVLKSKQVQLDLPQHKLVQDVQTRWNSSYDMIKRYLEQEPAIHAALSSPDVKKNLKDVVTLSCDDMSQAEHIMNVLEPLKTVTNIMCSERTPTVSLISPMKAIILETMVDKPDDSTMVKEVKRAVRNDLSNRYEESDINRFLLMASAMDPRFKCLPKLDDEQRNDVYADIKERVLSLGDIVKVFNSLNLRVFFIFSILLAKQDMLTLSGTLCLLTPSGTLSHHECPLWNSTA